MGSSRDHPYHDLNVSRVSWLLSSADVGEERLTSPPAAPCCKPSIGAEASAARIISAPAPFEPAPDSRQPERTQQDPAPHAGHERVAQHSVVEARSEEHTSELQSRLHLVC